MSHLYNKIAQKPVKKNQEQLLNMPYSQTYPWMNGNFSIFYITICDVAPVEAVYACRQPPILYVYIGTIYMNKVSHSEHKGARKINKSSF